MNNLIALVDRLDELLDVVGCRVRELLVGFPLSVVTVDRHEGPETYIRLAIPTPSAQTVYMGDALPSKGSACSQRHR